MSGTGCTAASYIGVYPERSRRDGLGERVEKQSAQVLFWYGAYGELLEITPALNGANPSDWIYFAWQRIARQDPSAVYYMYGDALGSLRTITDASGNITRNSDYYPFGSEDWLGGSGYDANQFAGLYRDSEDLIDTAAYRRYNSSLARWLSPDPLGGDISNPQSLNRYAYALNNPTNMVDPLGLDPAGEICVDVGTSYPGPQCFWNPYDASLPTCVAYGSEGCILPPFGYPGGGGGGGSSGGGGTASGPPGSTPMPGASTGGISSFPNGVNVCSVIVFPGAPGIPGSTTIDPCTATTFPQAGALAAATGALAGAIAALLHKPWVFSWTIPLVGEPGVAGVGPSGSFYWNPATHNFCGSFGAGLAGGHSGTIGPVTNAWTLQGVPATPSQVDNIFKGWSWSVGGNLASPSGTIGPGVQVSGNGSGVLLNPNVGVAGAGISSTYGFCSQ